MSHLFFLRGPAETFLCSKRLRFNIVWPHCPLGTQTCTWQHIHSKKEMTALEFGAQQIENIDSRALQFIFLSCRVGCTWS